MTNSASFGTGDINFACALMALGVPLDESNPCTIVAHQNGHVYSRYHFGAISYDGRFRTGEISNAWSNITSIPDEHPLRVISDFIQSAPKGMRLHEWFDHAHCVFAIGHIKDMEDAQRHISAFPENPESYCLAHILNRRELLTLHMRANRETFMTNGTASALIGVGMPNRQKQELINRMNG
jgi:hypothetical protein